MVRMVKTQRDIAQRARRIHLVLTDNDGVLTDTGVYYSSFGEELKRYSVRDGMAVELLRQAGIETGIMTGEESESVRRRAEKLRIRHVYLGVRDKRRQLDLLLAQTKFSLSQIAYIGDDVNDLGILTAIGAFGLTAAPADAVSAIRHAVQFVCRTRGGQGAFREFADHILALREPRSDDRRRSVTPGAIVTYGKDT